MRKSKAKERLADMIEGYIEEHLEELLEYCEKHRLSYSFDLKIWKWGEKPAD